MESDDSAIKMFSSGTIKKRMKFNNTRLKDKKYSSWLWLFNLDVSSLNFSRRKNHSGSWEDTNARYLHLYWHNFEVSFTKTKSCKRLEKAWKSTLKVQLQVLMQTQGLQIFSRRINHILLKIPNITIFIHLFKTRFFYEILWLYHSRPLSFSNTY